MRHPTKQAFILAAGHGKRMRPLSDKIPKPLLRIGGKSLLEWHLLALARAGVQNAIINHGRLGSMIEQALGDGRHFGLRLQYSAEGEEPLETAGGIIKAMPLLNDAPFFLINADVWIDVNFATLELPENALAHLVLVDNPPHNPEGDFSLKNGKVGARRTDNSLTYSGVGIYRPELFSCLPAGKCPLAPLLRKAATHGQLSGTRHCGYWLDIGTPERLAAAQRIDQMAHNGI
ncbi:MAG: N-acetylmuramate alpha-1-phosphate uridylyltransferase MurU [Candidatus Eutrophobiaceae bacterium]